MNDTHPKVAEHLKKWMVSQSPEKRLMIGCSMYDTAKALVVASLREKTPHITDLELRREVFLRFYRADFAPATLEKILDSFDSPPTHKKHPGK